MIIICNSCNSRFNIDERLIKPQGSKVKCSKCQTVFVVHPPKQEEEMPPVPPAPALLDDEDSGVDIEKDFVKSDRPAAKPVFEEPDVVGGAPIPPPAKPAAQPTRVPRRVPARSAGAAGMPRGERSLSAEMSDHMERPAKSERPERAARPETLEQPEKSDRLESPESGAERRVTGAAAATGAAIAGRSLKRPAPPSKSAMSPQSGEGFAEDDTFRDDFEATHPAKGKGARGDAGKPDKKGSGTFKKLLLLILIIIILLLVAAFTLPKVGVEVPFLDKLNISALLSKVTGDTPAPPALPNTSQNNNGQGAANANNTTTPPPSLPIQDTNGILHFYMDPELVNSGILGNTSSGIVIIVEGLLQNNYDEPRKAVKIVGRLYNEKYELEQEKIVYAGNVLTEEDLVTLNPMEIENRLFVNGREATVQANSTIPFMLVFSNIPEPISAYTYECELVSSEPAEPAAALVTPVSPEPTL